jgi:hypothetical protein
MAYKWKHPQDWLFDKMKEARPQELFSLACELLQLVDADQVQDVFEAEMDADGYFDEDEHEA